MYRGVIEKVSQLQFPGGGGGGGSALPVMDYTGRLRPKGVPFSSLTVYKRVGISRVEVYKRVGKTEIYVLKGSFKISRTDAPNCLFMQVVKGSLKRKV